MTKENNKNDSPKIGIVWLLAVIAIVVFAWTLSWALLHIFVLPDDRGAFGDMFGAINSLFSGFAFVGLIFAIILQRQELTETRKALLQQKDEMAKQNFENAFFQLLRLHGNNVMVIEREQVIGISGFKHYYHDYLRAYLKSSSDINSGYQAFFDNHQAEFGHYFRNLYHIVKLVDRNDLEDKQFYINIIRAQLSSYELVILFYNCLSDLGSERFKPLIEEYSLLESLDHSLLLDETDVDFYKPSAFDEPTQKDQP